MLAFGIALVFAGLATSGVMTLIGAVLAVAGVVGWFGQTFPRGVEVSVPVEAEAFVPRTSRASVERLSIPGDVRPAAASAGVLSGLRGGEGRCRGRGGDGGARRELYGVLSGHGLWYPINLLAAGFFPAMAGESTAQLSVFSPAAFAVALVIHVITSLLVGVLYGAMLPMLPRRPILLGGVVAPLLWTGLLHSTLSLINPVMADAHRLGLVPPLADRLRPGGRLRGLAAAARADDTANPPAHPGRSGSPRTHPRVAHEGAETCRVSTRDGEALARFSWSERSDSASRGARALQPFLDGPRLLTRSPILGWCSPSSRCTPRTAPAAMVIEARVARRSDSPPRDTWPSLPMRRSAGQSPTGVRGPPCPPFPGPPEASSATRRSTPWSAGSAPGRRQAPDHNRARHPTLPLARGIPSVGRKAFREHCGTCHGADGRGAQGGGRSIVDGSFLALVSDASLRTTVIAGRPDLGSPGWRETPGGPLSAEDVTDVVAWLASHRVPFPGQPYPNAQAVVRQP